VSKRNGEVRWGHGGFGGDGKGTSAATVVALGDARTSDRLSQ